MYCMSRIGYSTSRLDYGTGSMYVCMYVYRGYVVGWCGGSMYIES